MRQMPMQMLYDMLLDRVIDFRLLANEAERQKVGDDPAVGPALAQARAAVLREFLIQQTIEEGLTEEKLRARYEEKKAQEGFVREEVHARHILVPTEDEAKAVIEELQGGADFAEVAEARSTGPSGPAGGDLGFISREQVVPEFADAAFALNAGETSAGAGPDPVRLACHRRPGAPPGRADLSTRPRRSCARSWRGRS